MSAHSVIIGGTRGVGRELVRLFQQQGHVVSVVGRREPEPEDRELPQVHYWTADIAIPGELTAALGEIVGRNGPVNHVVFLQRYKGSGDTWAGEWETSLVATRLAIETLLEHFAAEGDKAIVVVSSIADQFIADGQPVGYHVAKAGLHQLANYYAVALGPKGIRVNCVAPSTFQKRENESFYGSQGGLVDLFRRTIPLRRMGTAVEVANVIAFLCGPQSSFVTGQRIAVDGGVSLLAQESLSRRIAGL
jgi:NAD(P)-dependent dehydrogenase (short-subunit alcohol dehydrogenase family)